MRALSPHWKAWRKRRRRSLIAKGCALSVATRLAANEARGRARVGETIGDDLATVAALRVCEVGGEIRFSLVGRWDQVSPGERDTLATLIASQATIRH